MDERRRCTGHIPPTAQLRNKRFLGHPVILRRPRPTLHSRATSSGLSCPRAPAESTRAAHGCPEVPCTLERSHPRLAPAQAPARTWTRSSVPPLVLSAPREGNQGTSPLQPTSQAGRGGRTGGACSRAPIPCTASSSTLLQRAVRLTELSGLGPEAQEDPPKCREMCGGTRARCSSSYGQASGARHAPGTRWRRGGHARGSLGSEVLREELRRR